MDVRCDQCQTVYELDDTRLKPGGVTVKCTQCQYQCSEGFKSPAPRHLAPCLPRAAFATLRLFRLKFPIPSSLVPRDASAFVPDLWLRLGKANMSLEMEGAAVLGAIDTLSDQGISNAVDIVQLGAVVRFGAHWLEERLKFGFETGYASGDSADSPVPGNVHISTVPKLPAPGDSKYSLFAFDRDYHVDMIYFRQIAGAVHNAVYLRPSLSFDFAKAFRISAVNITSFAARPVATPGNASALGTEFDLGLSFEGEAISLGLGYGLFIPFAGLDHRAGDATNDGFGFSTLNTGDAGNAQSFQFRAALKF
ncbi:MAG: zinc-ribbon domain-containing protein [Myxococcales bacterium]|nr:zinc-ribbon domain-containing protein [Myxococcales bacterium]